jgi:hypothetical protein
MKQFLKSQTCGSICALLLVLLLCESRLFNFFINSFLGKMLLIGLIMYFSHIHKILGVVVVLFIIIIFNNNITYYEGFDNGDNLEDNSDTLQDKNGSQSDDNSSKIKARKMRKNKNNDNDTDDDHSGTKAKAAKIKQNNDSNNDDTDDDDTEGFDMMSHENNIKRGKASNSIQVDPYMNSSTSVEPFEGSSNIESFSVF